VLTTKLLGYEVLNPRLFQCERQATEGICGKEHEPARWHGLDAHIGLIWCISHRKYNCIFLTLHKLHNSEIAVQCSSFTKQVKQIYIPQRTRHPAINHTHHISNGYPANSFVNSGKAATCLYRSHSKIFPNLLHFLYLLLTRASFNTFVTYGILILLASE